MTDLRKWSENAFVMLAGLKESVQWELAPAIMKEIRELVDAYPVGAAPSEGMKADSNLPPEKMTAHNGVAVGLSPARSGEPSAPQTPTVTKQAATCNCYGNDIPHTHAAPQTSAETQLCKCGHHWRKHRYSEFWCDSCECKKFAAAPQPVSGDTPKVEGVWLLECDWHDGQGFQPFGECFYDSEEEANAARLHFKIPKDYRAVKYGPYFPPASQKETDYFWKDGSLKWGHPIDVGHMILQLQTLDPKMKVSSVMHIDMKGGTKARAYGLSMSRERWDEGGWLNWELEGPECLAIWAKEREPIEGLNPWATPASTARTDGWPDLLYGDHEAWCGKYTRNGESNSGGNIGAWYASAVFWRNRAEGILNPSELPAVPGSVPQAPDSPNKPHCQNCGCNHFRGENTLCNDGVPQAEPKEEK